MNEIIATLSTLSPHLNRRTRQFRQLLAVHGDLFADIVSQNGVPGQSQHAGLEDHLQGAEIHAADIKFARQKWRGVFNPRQYFPDRRNRQDSCKSSVTFGEGIVPFHALKCRRLTSPTYLLTQ